ncbi:MAG: hypothetical protein K0S01_3737 [Herbinix sp.]|jgi:hypothetical protein|nr:hypothetical protein [Herbinix sp.]
MKKFRVLCILILITICIISVSIILINAYEPKGGEGTGMFEFPAVSIITLSTDNGKLVDITDVSTIHKIQDLCKADNAFIEINETLKNKWTCDIWVDFNNTRTVIGMCSKGAYGNLELEKTKNVNLIISKELYDYIIKLLK